MKKLLSLIFTISMIVSLVGCQSAKDNQPENIQPEIKQEENLQAEEHQTDTSGEAITITVGVPTAPPALPILRMAETNALGENVTIDIDIWHEPETLIAMVQDGKHDMFAFPLTVVSKLYNKGMDVRLMNVNTWGVTYFMTSDPEIKDWSDLKGKTVYVPLQSSPPDALTQYFLSEANLKVGENVEIIYASTAEVATLLASGEADYATLIEPQVTKALIANSDLRVAFSFEEEWQRVNNTDTKIPNAGFGTTQKFIDENPELMAKFQEAYEEAAIWANENPKEMGVLAEKYLGLNAALVEKALPNMGLTFQSAADSKAELDMFYNLLKEFEPTMIGGKIPDDLMFYDAE